MFLHFNKSLLLFICASLLCYNSSAQLASQYNYIINENTTNWSSEKLEIYAKEGLNVVDNYMSNSHYDSAQTLIDKLMTSYPINKSTLTSYLLTVRQSEILYYNHLLQFGKDDVRAQLKIAKELNDSFLLSDAYNFLGLFYLAIDSIEEAKNSFENGIKHINNKQLPKTHHELTSPHHLFGNLAETYQKLNEHDSALKYTVQSKIYAQQINRKRGEGIAYITIAKSWLGKNEIDSAELYYYKSLALHDTVNYDVVLLTYTGLGFAALKRNNIGDLKAFVNKGFELMDNIQNINLLFTKDFLIETSKLYHAINYKEGIYLVNERMVHLDSLLQFSTLNQTNQILQTSIDRANKLLRMEVASANYKQERYMFQFYIALAVITILLLSFLIYRFRHREKMKMELLRNNISKDLHDDIGATLSSIQIFGSVAEKTMEKEPGKALSALKSIKDNSKDLVNKMSDMIWAIDSNVDPDKTFSYRIKNFFYDLTSVTDVQCTYDIDPQIEASLTHPDVKKNLLFITKEAINNAMKYSTATSLKISFAKHGNKLILEIKDNGKGFDIEKVKKGNGLNNIISRAEQLGGKATVLSNEEQGTTISCTFPLTIISDKL